METKETKVTVRSGERLMDHVTIARRFRSYVTARVLSDFDLERANRSASISSIDSEDRPRSIRLPFSVARRAAFAKRHARNSVKVPINWQARGAQPDPGEMIVAAAWAEISYHREALVCITPSFPGQPVHCHFQTGSPTQRNEQPAPRPRCQRKWSSSDGSRGILREPVIFRNKWGPLPSGSIDRTGRFESADSVWSIEEAGASFLVTRRSMEEQGKFGL